MSGHLGHLPHPKLQTTQWHTHLVTKQGPLDTYVDVEGIRVAPDASTTRSKVCDYELVYDLFMLLVELDP